MAIAVVRYCKNMMSQNAWLNMKKRLDWCGRRTEENSCDVLDCLLCEEVKGKKSRS